MDQGLKERLVGAAVLVAIAVWLIPWVLDGPENPVETGPASLQLPAAQEPVPMRTQTLKLGEPPAAAQPAATAIEKTDAPAETVVAAATPEPTQPAPAAAPASVALRHRRRRHRRRRPLQPKRRANPLRPRPPPQRRARPKATGPYNSAASATRATRGVWPIARPRSATRPTSRATRPMARRCTASASARTARKGRPRPRLRRSALTDSPRKSWLPTRHR